MKLGNLLVFALGSVDARPPEKQLQHLEKSSGKLFEHFFVNAMPDGDKDLLSVKRRRENRAKKMTNQYNNLNGLIRKALDGGCYPELEQRMTLIQRFDQGKFNKAITQITKNYLKMQISMDQTKIVKKIDGEKNPDFDSFCYIKRLAMGRKTDRFYARSRTHYCKLVKNEDFCAKNKDYTLPERTKNKVEREENQ